MINFLHSHLLPEIECNSVATEGHDVCNLVSSNSHSQSQGFLAERFISGPVEITMKLICPVNIKRILIWNKVSNQKSLGFEISALHSQNNNMEKDYKRIASVVLPSNIECVEFRKEGQSRGQTENPALSHYCTFFRGKNHENVVELRLKIFKFQYVAAVKRIEVWGVPHYSCKRLTKTRVYSLWNRSQQKPDDVNVNNVINEFQESDVVDMIDTTPLLNIEIPEDFHDEITNEIMTLPMILPSGKVVDYQTLERFQNEEAKWGRRASDPFTGVVFSAFHKPVVATSLKLKIDAFLAKNPNLYDVKTLPRRLGSRNEYQNSINPIKQSELVSNDSRKRKYQSIYYQNEKNVMENMATINETNRTVNVLNKKAKMFPSFLEAPKFEEKSTIVCSRCCASSISILYRLSCTHIICRICLIDSRNRCNQCGKDFLSAEVEKIHVLQNTQLEERSCSVSLLKNITH